MPLGGLVRYGVPSRIHDEWPATHRVSGAHSQWFSGERDERARRAQPLQKRAGSNGREEDAMTGRTDEVTPARLRVPAIVQGGIDSVAHHLRNGHERWGGHFAVRGHRCRRRAHRATAWLPHRFGTIAAGGVLRFVWISSPARERLFRHDLETGVMSRFPLNGDDGPGSCSTRSSPCCPASRS